MLSPFSFILQGSALGISAGAAPGPMQAFLISETLSGGWRRSLPLIFVPILTPYLSGLWLALVTPATYEVGRHLIEGLKNPTVVRDSKALEAFAVRPIGVAEAIEAARKVSESPS